MKKLKVMFFAWLLFCAGIVQGQMGLPAIIPPTPEAAALAKYGDVPVSLYTGTPSIEIPLYELHCSSLSLPIYLSYYASGIKIEDMPSWCGAGWTLHAGGVITRTIRDAPNDIRPNQGLPIPTSGHTPDHFHAVNNLAFGAVDREGDIFHYNFNGYSGTFYFNQSGVVLKQYSDLKIEWVKSWWHGSNTLTQFIVTTSDGTKYFFDIGSYQTEWYLKEIRDANGLNSIFFEYLDADEYIVLPRNSKYYSFTSGIPTPSPVAGDWSYYTTKRLGKYLKKIHTSNGDSVVFITKALGFEEVPLNAEDPNTHHKALDLMHIYNFNGDKVKSFHFDTKNIKTIWPYSLPTTGYPTVALNYKCDYRVYLEGVSEISTNGESLVHHFEYYGRTQNGMDSLPNTFSFAQDFGGYYNGELNNQSLLPSFFDFIVPGENITNRCVAPFISPQVPVNIPGANRNTSFNHMRMGTLKLIKYPTALTTQFHFSQQFIGSDPYWAMKVDKIEYFDSENNLIKGKHYEYLNPSLGHNIPSHFGYLYSYNGASVSLVPHCDCTPFGPCEDEHIWKTTLEISPGPRQDLGLFEGPMIGYGTVKEFEEGNGYTVYEFSNESDYLELDNFLVETLSYNPNVPPGYLNLVYGAVPFGVNYAWPLGPFPSNKSWKRGILLSKAVYREDNVLLSSTNYDYSFIELEKIPSIKTLVLQTDLHNKYYQYDQVTSWIKLNSVTETINGVTTTTAYQYNAQKQKSVESVVQSDGKTRSVEYKYAYDFIPSQPYQAMTDRHIHAPVIEQTEKINSNAIRRVKNNYDFFQSNTVVAPSQVLVQNGSGPFETRLTYHSYDSKGNLQRVSMDGAAPVSYLWGYQQSYPIAKALNVTENQIAYTSFENPTSKGGWSLTLSDPSICPDLQACLDGCSSPSCEAACMLSYNQCIDQLNVAPVAKTGNWSLKSGSISKSGLSSGDYKLTFWAKRSTHGVSGNIVISPQVGSLTVSSNEWVHYEFTLNATTTVSLTVTDALVDELRLQPVNTQMTTYTYDPLIGMTSATDENSVITYYEYDSFNRLQAIKDQYGNVLKTYTYHYRKQN